MTKLPLGNDIDLDESTFYNRVEDIKFLSSFLNTTKDGSTPAILLTGVRGVGKTALMKKLKKDFINDYLIIYVDLSSANNYHEGNFTRFSFMKIFYDEILTACNDFGFMTLDKKLEKIYKTRNLKLDKITDFNNFPIPILHTEEDYSKFADFVMDLPSKIYKEYSHQISGVLIFFDEFQIIKELDSDVNSFLWYIRSFIQSQKNIAYTFSGSMSIKDSLIEEIAGRNGVFGGRMLNFELKPFTFETTKSYLSERAPYLNFTEDGIKQFYKCTNGIPFYINSFARFLSPEDILNKNNVITEFKNILPFLVIHLTNIWYKLTKQEQKIITTLIEKPLRRSDISNKLGVTSGAIGNSLNSLQDKVLIEMDNGYYKLTDNIFKFWLKTEHEKKGVYPYRAF